MKKSFLLIIAFCIFFSNTNAQKTYSKDSTKNNIGILLSIENEYDRHIAFIDYGIDYNRRISNRFSVGCTSSYGYRSLDKDHLFYIQPYLRTDMLTKKISPFIDLGLGYKYLSDNDNNPFIPGYHSNKKYNKLFVSSRLGLCFVNKKYFSLAFVVQYQIFIGSWDYWGYGFLFNLKK